MRTSHGRHAGRFCRPAPPYWLPCGHFSCSGTGKLKVKDAGNYTTTCPFHSSLSFFVFLSILCLSVCLPVSVNLSVFLPFQCLFIDLCALLYVLSLHFLPHSFPFPRVSLVYVGACVYVYFEYTRVQYLDLHSLYRPPVTPQTANLLVAQFGIATRNSGSKHYSSGQTIPHSMSLPMLGRHPVRTPDIVAYTAQVCWYLKVVWSLGRAESVWGQRY